MASKSPPVIRVRIAREELDKMSKEQLQKCWNLQDQYIDLIENKLQSGSEHSELMSLRESEEKLKQQQLDASRRENILVMRLTTKEHEMQEFAAQIQELKQAQVPTIAQLRSAMLDPAVNLLFERMRKEVDALKARLEETQNELSAWKFTPDSNTGKRLMAKCRLLYQENEELGKIISSGKMAKLEGDLALQKNFSEEMKKSQSELDEFLLELDEDVEGMQSTIYYLQQQLREAKEQIAQLQKEKLEHLDLPNGLPENNLSVRSAINCKSQHISENIKLCTTSKVPLGLNEINGTNDTPVGAEKEPSSEIAEFDEDIKPNISEIVLNLPIRKEVVNEVPIIRTESVVQSVIVKNEKTSSIEKPIPVVERTNVIVDSIDSSENSVQKRTNDQTLEKEAPPEKKSTEEELLPPEIPKNTPAQQNTLQKSNRRTSEGGRGRKRTRPCTPVEVDSIKDESCLPVRKRTRRRDAEIAQQEAIVENNRTASVEIDTDTEVQVAQTLASWASTKQQERTEVKPDADDSSLGNGELSKIDCKNK